MKAKNAPAAAGQDTALPEDSGAPASAEQSEGEATSPAKVAPRPEELRSRAGLVLAELAKTAEESRKKAASLREVMQATRERIATLEAEAKEIRARPLSRSDFLRVVLTDLDRYGKAKAEKIAQGFRGLIGREKMAAAEMYMDPTRSRADVMPFGNPITGVGGRFDPLLGIDATGLLVESTKEQCRAAVALIDPWPNDAPDWMDANLARLREIGEELAELKASLAGMHAQVREVTETYASAKDALPGNDTPAVQR